MNPRADSFMQGLKPSRRAVAPSGRSSAVAWGAALLLGLVAVVLIMGSASAQVTPPIDKVVSKASALSGVSGQVLRLELTLLPAGQTGAQDVNKVEFTVNTTEGYTIDPETNQVGPPSWDIKVETSDEASICGALVSPSCNVIRFTKGTGGSDLKVGTTTLFRVNVTTPAGADADRDPWHARAYGATTTGDFWFPVQREPVGIRSLSIHSPQGAVDPGGRIITESQAVNFSLVVKNSRANDDVTLKVRFRTDSSTDPQETKGNQVFTVLRASESTFSFDIFGFSYNFSSRTGARQLTVNLTISTPTTVNEVGFELAFDVKIKPRLVNADTTLRFLPGASPCDPAGGEASTNVSARNQPTPAPKASTLLRAKFKNTGEAAATGIGLTLKLVDSNGDNLAGRFTVTPQVQAPPASLPGGSEFNYCFKIETKVGATPATTTPEGLYTVRVELNYNDENTRVKAPNDGTACTASCVPVITEFREAAILTVDSSFPTVSNPLLPGTVEFERGGAAKRDVKVRITDTHLDEATVEAVLEQPAGTEVARFKMARVGTSDDFNANIDFSQFERLAGFRVNIEAKDFPGNLAKTPIGVVSVQDLTSPVLVTGPTGLIPAGASVRINEGVTFQAELRENFKMKSVSNVLQVFLVPLHIDERGVETERDTPTAMTPFDNPPKVSGSGLYSATFTPQLSGVYRMRIRAIDEAGHDITFASFYTLNVTSSVTLRVKPAGTEVSEIVLPVGAQVSQAKPARFGTSNNTAGSSLNTDPRIIMTNTAPGSDEFVFKCALMSQTNLSGVTGCVVDNAVQAGALGAKTPVGRAGVVTITVFPAAASAPDTLTLDPFPAEGSRFTVGAHHLTVVVTVPPSARPGQVANVTFTAQARFYAPANQTIHLNYTVVAVFDSKARHPGTETPPVLEKQFDVKRSRSITVPILVENRGNVETNFTLSTVRNGTGDADGWKVELLSADPRFNPVTNVLRLSPIGSSGLANQSTINVKITAANDASPGVGSPPRTVTMRASNTSIGPNAEAVVKLNVLVPTVFVSTPIGIKSVTTTSTTSPSICQSTTPFTCTFEASAGFTYTFQVHALSSRNTNPNFGVLRPNLVVEAPDGSRTRDLMQLVSADDGGTLILGKDGVYELAKTFTDTLGRYSFHFEVTEIVPDPDLLITDPTTFLIREPTGTGTDPTLSNIQLLQDGQAVTRNLDNTFDANYGSNITVRVTLTDNLHIGRGTVRIFQVLASGAVPAVPPEVAMTRSSEVKVGNRVTSAVLEGTFRPTLPPADGIGLYSFSVEAFDSQLDKVAQPPNPNDLPLNVRLSDLRGPTFVFARMAAGSATGDNLDVEQNVNVTLAARVVDNGDLVPGSGSNVDPATVRIALRLGGVERLNQPMVAVPGSGTDYNFTLGRDVLATTGSYQVMFSAADRTGAVSTVNRTLQVLANLPPVINMTSPQPGADGVRYAAAGTPVTVTVEDANVDQAAPGAIVVEVDTGTGNFTRVTPQISGQRPVLTLTIPVAGDQVSIRVSATDTLGLSNTATFQVRVDTSAPTGASINVDPLDIGSRAYRASAAENFALAPSARLFVSASDGGSGVAGVAVTARAGVGGVPRTINLSSPTARFTLGDVLGATIPDGSYVVSARVTDRAGNAANAPEVTVTLDRTPPAAGVIRPTDPLAVTVTDATGVRTVEVAWSDGPGGASQTFLLAKGAGNDWSGDFPLEARGNVVFTLRLTDLVGNAQDADCAGQPCSLAFGNRAPRVTLALTSEGRTVAAGGTVRGNVSVAWTAEDPEGAQVLVTIRARDAQGNERVLASDASLSPVTWDTSLGADGSATLTLVGSDGLLTNTTTLNVAVRNLRVQAANPLPASVPQGASVPLSFEVSHPTKGVKNVQAVLRVGDQRETVPLQEAQQGTWGAAYTPRLSGQYTVDLQVTYDDDTPATLSNVGTFRTEGAGAPVSIAAAVPAIVLGVLVIALGVFGIRRWK